MRLVFRAHGLKAFAKALTFSIRRSFNPREPICHDSLTTSAPPTCVVCAVLSTEADWAVDGADLSAWTHVSGFSVWVRYGTADLLGVCDVKDLMGFLPEGCSPGSDFSVQPRIPEAANIYCTLRANFAL